MAYCCPLVWPSENKVVRPRTQSLASVYEILKSACGDVFLNYDLRAVFYTAVKICHVTPKNKQTRDA